MIELLRVLLKASSTEKITRLAATSNGVLEANARRISITFCPPSAGTATFSTLTPAVALEGIVVRSTDRPVCLSLLSGDYSVTKAWNAIHSAGGVNANIMETWLGET